MSVDQHQLKKLLVGLNAGLVLIVLLAGASFWRAVERERQMAREAEKEDREEKAGRVATVRPRSYYAVIEDHNPFSPGARSGQGVKSDGSGAQAAAGLRLRGTIVGDPSSSLAIIEDTDAKKQGLYRLGETIRGMKLSAIEARRVILERGAERLVLEIASGEATVSPAPKAEMASAVRAAGEIQVAGDRRVLERQFVQESFSRANELLSEVRVIPHKGQGGEPDGYWLGNIKPGGVVERLGFKNGDVLQKVNGLDVNTVENIFQAYQALQGSSEIVVELVRGSAPASLTFEIKD